MTKFLRCFSLFIICLFSLNYSKAQTVVTVATAINNMCVSNGYSPVGTITIAEGVVADFSSGTGLTYIISAPTGFEFNTAVTPIVTKAGTGISNIAPSAPTATTFTVQYDVSAGSTIGGALDQLIINGLQARAIAVTSTGNILRSGGTAVQASNAVADTKNHCTLTSVATVPITITSQPANAAGCVSGDPTFSVIVTGTTPSYAWERDKNDGNGFGTPPGASYSNVTTATITADNVIAAQDGYLFQCTISNVCGSVVSNIATLQVDDAVVISAQPPNRSICSGTGTTFTITASQVTTYKWQLDPNNSGTFTDVPATAPYSGITTSTLSLSNVAGLTGYKYRCVLTNACGTFISNSGTLTVNTATAINTQPVNNIACTGDDPTFSVSATGSTLTYTWERDRNDGNGFGTPPGTSYSNVTTATITADNVATTQDGYLFRCTVTGACGAVVSNIATLAVSDLASITSQPTAQTKCAGGTATYTVVASNATSYQWHEGISGTYTPISNGGVYSGATTATLTLTGVTIGMTTRTYRCVVSNAVCTTLITSNALSLTVVAGPSISVQPADGATCVGVSKAFTITASGTTVFQWQEGISGVYSNVGTNSATFTRTGVTAAMDGRTYRCSVSNATCTTPITSNIATLTVNTPPVITTQPTDVTACAGSTPSFSVTASGTGLTYEWQRDRRDGDGFSDAPSPFYTTSLSGSTSTVTVTNAPDGVSTSQNDYLFKCIITGTCGNVTSSSKKLTVYSAGTLTYSGLDASYCKNAAPVTLTGFPAGGTFSIADVGSASALSATNSTTGTATFTPKNAAAGSQTISYTLACSVPHSTTIIDTTNIDYTSPANASPSFFTTDPPVDLVVETVPATGPIVTGTYTGSGVSGTKFYPTLVSAGGPYPVLFTYTNPSGCVSKVTKPITVTSPGRNIPILQSGTPFCQNAPIVLLDETTVQGGDPVFTPGFYEFDGYSGTGIVWQGGNNYIFNPVNPGSYVINYNVRVLTFIFVPPFGFNFEWRTSVYASQTVTVNTVTPIDFNLPASVCYTGGDISLTPFPGVLAGLQPGVLTKFTIQSPASPPAGFLKADGITLNPAVVGSNTNFTIRYTFYGSSCATVLDKQIVVFTKPTVPTVFTPDPLVWGEFGVNNEEFCYGTSRKNLGATSDVTGLNPDFGSTYTWKNNVGTVISNFFNLFPIVSDNAPGTYHYFVTRSVGGCTSDPLDVVMKINDRATVNAGPTQTICAGNSVILAGASTKFVSGAPLAATWISPSLGAFSPSASNLTPTYTPTATDISDGFVDLLLKSADPDGIGGPCPVDSQIVRIKINGAPVAYAGPDITYCSGSPIILSGQALGSATSISWSGGAGILNTPGLSSTLYTATPGEKSNTTITFVATTNDPVGPCPADTDQVKITIKDQAIVNAGPGQTICSGTMATLAGSSTRLYTAAPLTATWYSPSSGNFSPNANNLSAIYTPTAVDSAAGFVDLTLKSNDPDGTGPSGPCPVDSQVVRIRINRAALVSAGPDVTYCSSSPITLSSQPSGSATSITWSGGAGIINTPAQLTTSYAATSGEKSNGTIIFTATTNDPDGTGPSGPCPAVADQVSIKINDQAAINAGPTQTICSGTTTNLAGASIRLYSGAPLIATWYSPTSGSFSPNANNLSAIYTPTAADSAAGFVDLKLKSNDPDGIGPGFPCPVDSQIVRIRINRAALVTAGPDVTYCSDSPITLSGSPLGSATSLTWSGGVGTISNPNQFTPSYLPTNAEKSNGTVIFTATSNDPDGTGPSGPCPAVTDQVSIKINEQANISAGIDQAICRSKSITRFNLNGLSEYAISHTLLGSTWTGGLGSFSNNTSLNSTYMPHASEIPADGAFNNQVKLFLTTADPDGLAGPCPVLMDSIILTINPLPDVTSVIVPSNSFCKSPTATSFLLGANVTTPYFGNGIFSDTTTVAPGVVGNLFIPTAAGVGQHRVYHIYTDGHGCKNDHDTLIYVYGIPRVRFVVQDFCAEKPTKFDAVNSDVIDITNASKDLSSTINSWSWTFGNNTSSSIEAPNCTYTKTLDPSAKQTFIVSLTLGTDHQCSAQKDTTIIVGNIPPADFSWSRICPSDNATSFVDISSFPPSEVNQYFWDFNDGTSPRTGPGLIGGIANTTDENPFHKMANGTGAYNVKFKITSNFACADSATHKVNILPEHKPTALDPYAINFANTDGFWSVDGQNPSWQWGTAAKSNINTGSRKVWVTNTTGTYNVNEKSFLNGPCLNFANLVRPMVSLKIQSATQNQIAGAILQSSVDGGLTWNVVGSMGSGINWYDNSSVIGNPGTQSLNQFAWTGTYPDFEVSKNNLNYLKGNASVRLRLAFGSGQDNLNLKNGFAIDSIWVGERDKLLLIENFTNSTSSAAGASDLIMNDLVASKANDVVAIHYHTGFPGIDQMNLRDQADPSSRVLYYGVPSVPRVTFEGNYNYGAVLDSVDIDRRSLDAAKFEIKVKTTKALGALSVAATIIAKDTVKNNFAVQIAVIERNATVLGNTYQWVLTRMLPDASGTYFTQDFYKNDSASIAQTWNYSSGQVYDTAQLGVIVFIQDIVTKEVYQTAYVLGAGDNNAALGLKHELLAGQELFVYPNPADNIVNIMFKEISHEDYTYTVCDELGRVVAEGILGAASNVLTLHTSEFAGGLYVIRVGNSADGFAYKKLMVTH